MTHKFELLAPGGGVDAIKAAIVAGADAVYCGLEKFSARDRAANVPIDDVNGIVRLAHTHNCFIFITLNIILLEHEFPTVVKLLNKLVNTNIDGVIVQDLGLLYLLNTHFKNLKIHASTQLTTHNTGQIKFLKKLSAARVNLCRELNINEIEFLTRVAHQHNVATEVFVHGANCISFSGLCYMSSVKYGNSGNRGRCSQPCREEYETTPQKKRFPLNLKDNTAFLEVPLLWDARVDSLKIEGRIKKSNYVYSVVKVWRDQLQRLYGNKTLSTDTLPLRNVYHRDFTNSFISGSLNKDMFIDNPKDHSAKFLLKQSGAVSDAEITKANKKINESKKALIEKVKLKIKTLSIAKAPLTLTVSGKAGTPLKISINTPDVSFEESSEMSLTRALSRTNETEHALPIDATSRESTNTTDIHPGQLTPKLFQQKFNSIKNTEYYIEKLNLALEPGLFIPYEEITKIKNKILFVLMGNRTMVAPVDPPTFPPPAKRAQQPTLSVLLSEIEDLHLSEISGPEFYFELPNELKNSWRHYGAIFEKHPQLIPWFPAILIAEHYTAAKKLLRQIRPDKIVTNNLGIASEAFEAHIPWIAGPYLNIANSLSLHCLKDRFNCQGAFISNELSCSQIKRISAPPNMDLYYSIFHPIELLTSRQCLFHQVTGCDKDHVDDTCIEQCEKSAQIINMKAVTSFVEKTKGNYHRIYFERHFLNTKIITDLPNEFTSFFIDLKNTKTKTKFNTDKLSIINLFQNSIQESPERAISAETLEAQILPTTVNQYSMGI